MDYEKIFERIQSGETVKEIADELGCSTSKIQRGLKKAGFEYDSNKWVRGEGQPLNNQTTSKEQVNNNIGATKQQVNNNNTTISQFSNEEVAILKEMIVNFKKGSFEDIDPLYVRLKSRYTGKERNNIFLNVDVQKRLDDFLKDNNLDRNKSLIVELALEDFMKKYSK
ncbi:helix-turn-helix domain-containing protein [Bacillus cereus group sp. Bce025]